MSEAEVPSTPRSTPPKIGSYRLVEPLGSGGMGSVFRGIHEQTGAVVAVKVLPRSLAKNPTLLQRFLREAKSAESLQHHNIVEIFDRGTEDGRYYIVLEFMPGGDLHDVVRREGPRPIPEALETIKGVARGLRHAAERGLIHRDIKPANLLRAADGHVKITDLGLALQTVEEDERVTRDGTTVGTVDYMSPEQARDSRATSVRSDIYSLGCTFYFLLTGSPPFPGGSLVEKLRHHANDPPPDVRALRPDAPEELADLIKRMLAKKPDRRFLDYDHLLQALDDLPVAPPTQALTALIDDEEDETVPPAPGPAPLMALIDDEEDEDAPPPGPALTALIDEEDEPAPGPALTALIDEDDEEAGSGGFTLGPPAAGQAEPGSTRSIPTVRPGGDWAIRPADSAARSEVDLSGLAGVEEASPSERPRRPASSQIRAGAADAGPAPVTAPPPAPTLPRPGAEAIPLLGVQDADEGMEGPVTAPTLPPPDNTTQILVLRGALALIILAFLGIGAQRLISIVVNRPAQTGPGIELGDSKPRPDPEGAGKPADAGGPRPPAWVEPAERRDATAEAPKFPADELEAFGLADAEPSAPPPARPPIVTVVRAAPVQDREHRDTLPGAMSVLGAAVEVADDGPIFEDNLQVPGRDRVIRAAGGRRPVVVLKAPKAGSSLLNRPAPVVLEGTSLTVQGIDLVVPASALSPAQTCLFLLRKGAGLTLRDCTITVVGPIGRDLAVVQAGEPTEPGSPPISKVRLERTLVRGPGLTAVRLAGGPADVVVSRSVVLAGDAPAFFAAGGLGDARSVRLVGSLVSGSGPVFALAGSAAAPGSKPLSVRAFGTTFARAEPQGGTSEEASRSAAPGGLVALVQAPNGGPEGPGVDWKGDRNTFIGGGPAASGAAGGATRVALSDFSALKAAFPDTDARSRAVDEPWPAATQDGWASPDDLAGRSEDLAAALAAVARPTPNLQPWSVGSFTPLDANPASAGPAGVQEIDFDADTAPNSGDLGNFLAGKIRPGTRRVVVRARGTTWHPLSPIRLPAGVSFEMQVARPAAGVPADASLVWRPAEGSSGDALIDVRDADLTIVGATFERDAGSALKRVVRVVNGRMDLSGCVLTAPGSVETDGGGLVEFRSEGTRPLGPDPKSGGPRAACTLVDCVLITGGDALTADLGRGVVSLSQCAIASGSDAIVLRPQKVARDRFEADLRLDRCTLASEGNVVRLAPWPGHPDGPDRPWLVSTRACAFLDTYDRGRNPSTSVLLRADPEALARGALAWQSEGDAYHLTHFVVPGESTPRPVSFPDLQRLWVGFWGPSHVRDPRADAAGVRLVVERLTPGRVAPTDLLLAPASPRSASAGPVGADLARLGFQPRAEKPGPRR